MTNIKGCVRFRTWSNSSKNTKIKDRDGKNPDLGSVTNIWDHISESLATFFGVKN
jgi:hypothetical protein